MSSTRAAWKPRSAKTRIPASSSLAHRLAPLRAQLARCAGVPAVVAVARDFVAARRLRGLGSRRLVRSRLYAPRDGAPGDTPRRRRGASAILPPTSPSRLAAHVRATSTASPTRSRRACAPRGVGDGDVVALVLPPGPEYLARVPRRGEARRDHRGRERPALDRERAAVLDARRTAARRSPRPASRPTASDDRAGRRRRRGAPTASAHGCASRRRPRRRRVADDPDRPVAIIFTSGTTGLPKGALYCNRQLAFITQTDVGDAWGAGGRGLQRHVVRAPRVHDQAARQPPPRRHQRSS